MAKLEVSNEDLRLIQRALDLYSRIGILQFETILENPSIYDMIGSQYTSKKKLEVGDSTTRGTIVEMGKDFIKTEGYFNNVNEIREWKDVENVKLSPDWEKVHETRDQVRALGNQIKYLVCENKYSSNAGPGIHHSLVHDSCRRAFDIIQVIRHEFWKENPDRSSITVDSSVHFSTSGTSINVELDNPTA